MNSIFRAVTAALALTVLLSPRATAETVVTFTGEFTQVDGTVDTLGLVGSTFELAFEFGAGSTFAPTTGPLGGFGVIDAPLASTLLTIVDSTGTAITTDNDHDGIGVQLFQFVPAGLPNGDNGFFTNLIVGSASDFSFEIGSSVLSFDDEFFIDLDNLPSVGDVVSESTFDGTFVSVPATQSVVQVDGFVNEFGVTNVSFSVTTIPEPSSLGLLGLASFLAQGRRRRV